MFLFHVLGLQLRCSRVVSRVRVTTVTRESTHMPQFAPNLCTPCAIVFAVTMYAHGIEVFGSE